MFLRRWEQFIDYDAEAREQKLSPEQRLHLHQQHSKPLMEKLQQWMEAQFVQHLVEPNSGLGKAIQLFPAALEGVDGVSA